MRRPISACRETFVAGLRPIRYAAAAALAALLVACFAAGAWAHAVLVRSTPAAGGSVPAGELAFELHYNSRIDAGRSRLTLTGPGHAGTVLPVRAGAVPDELRAAATLAPGAYTLRWQVLATDGHITRGDVPFTVTGP
ncbi:MAG: copper resistance protein CopC [Proteobacteria bacterium]|nr:copper resistance protein CopC [Pseudomonadota bacterium]